MNATDLEALHGDIVVDQDVNRIARLTAAWLHSLHADTTEETYRRNLKAWFGWCKGRDLDPVRAERADIDEYQGWLGQQNMVHLRPLAPASIQQHLCALSSWYGYLLDEGTIGQNPVQRVKRPRVENVSKTRGLDMDEAVAVIAAAAGDTAIGGLCATAIIALMIHTGARVSEVCGIRFDDLQHHSGRATVTLRMKGGKTRVRALPVGLVAVLDEWKQHRAEAAKCSVADLSGPVFVNRKGRPVDRHMVDRAVKRTTARAIVHRDGLEPAPLDNPETVSPHSFRHTWARIARLAGASLEDRQFALGHGDPRTTQRYDHAARSIEDDPSLLVGDAIRTRTEGAAA